MRRLPILGLIFAVAGALLALAAPAGAQQPTTTTAASDADGGSSTDPGRVSVIKVQGLLDPVLADFIERSVRDGAEASVVAVVLQVDSSGSVVTDERLAELARTIHDTPVTVAMWVGPSGSSALGGTAQLAGVVDVVGISPGSRLGKTGDLVVPDELLSPTFLAAKDRLRTGTVDDEAALDLGVAPRTANVIGDFLIDIPGFETKQVRDGDIIRREPVTVPVFSALPVQDQLFHTVGSPPVAYLLFLIGLALIVFELYTAGVGIAGLVGAGAFVLSCYGLAVLPTRPWAVALLVLSVFGFTVDVQTGVPRVWSVIGTVALVVGSLALYDGLSLSWIALGVGIIGLPLFMIGGMPAMVRTRFSTPTIGREWMIGEEGEAVTNVDPDGVVRVRGALWRARTNRATPLALHDVVRVVEVDGLLLEVEPLEGGAKDHRERRGGGSDDEDAVEDGAVLVDGRPLPPADPD
ncbi:MAG: hypothetical protein KF906_08045 [Actinobacteria bacterium]|nr:hypothetical protein [Actinomycetota bacterium]